MKTFVLSWSHNYGLGACLIKADSIEQARIIAEKSDYIWDGYTIDEISDKLFDNNQIFFLSE